MRTSDHSQYTNVDHAVTHLDYVLASCTCFETTRVWDFLSLVTWTGWIGQDQFTIQTWLEIRMVTTPQSYSDAWAHVMSTWCARDAARMLKIDPGQCILYASNRLAVHQALYAFQLLRQEFSQFSKQDKYFHDENVLIRQTLIMQCFYNWFLWLPRQTRRLYGF